MRFRTNVRCKKVANKWSRKKDVKIGGFCCDISADPASPFTPDYRIMQKSLFHTYEVCKIWYLTDTCISVLNERFKRWIWNFKWRMEIFSCHARVRFCNCSPGFAKFIFVSQFWLHEPPYTQQRLCGNFQMNTSAFSRNCGHDQLFIEFCENQSTTKSTKVLQFCVFR